MDPYEIDLREIVMLNIRIFEFFGIIPKKSNSFWGYVIQVTRVSVLTGLFYVGLILAQLVKMVVSFKKGILEVVLASYFTLTNFFSLIKVVLIFIHRKRLLRLISTLNKDEFKPRSAYQREILVGHIKISRALTIALVLDCIGVCFFWCVVPLTVEDGPYLPLIAYIPYSVENRVVFALTYIFETIGIVVSACCCLPTDSLIAGLLMAVTAQLTLLNDNLKHLHKSSADEINTSDVDISEKIMNENIIKCVQHHQAIVKFKEEIESIFSLSMVGQFSLSVMVLCTTLFKFAMLENNFLDCVGLLLYICAMISEVFILCYFGNEVIIKHNQMTNSAYHCQWVTCSKVFRKNLIIFMTRSQKSFQLLAGGYFALSLETFIVIIKSSVSYLTVLNQVNSR